MADYWKSTPKYWCKHCTTYVTDTKLARANHEATGKHQSAVRRALRNLHRDHERQEREQDKAKREVERLNLLVGGEGAASSSTHTRPPRPPPPRPTQTNAPAAAAAAPREQLEQLAELGVSIPDEFRPDLAMAGDWTVTETRVVEEIGDTKSGEAGATRSVGVRKRPRGGQDGDDDEERPGQEGGHSEFEKLNIDAAVQGLFKRPRQWGRDSRTTAGNGGGDENGGDLDSLLSSALAKATKKEDKETTYTKEKVKKEDGAATTDDNPADTITPPAKIKQEGADGLDAPGLDETDSKPAAADEEQKPDSPETTILFKKRKTKTVRQR